MDNINWLSMVLATAMPLILGLIFFNNALFGNVLRGTPSNNNLDAKKASSVITLIVLVVFSFFLSFFLLNFNNSGINQEGDFDTFLHGIWHGTFIAITVASPVIFAIGYFSKMSWRKMLILILYWIVTLALMGGILDAMNHWENVVI